MAETQCHQVPIYILVSGGVLHTWIFATRAFFVL